MAFRWGERPESRTSTLKPPSTTFVYWASGTTDSQYVIASFLQTTPLMVSTVGGNLFRQDIHVQPEGYDLWEVSVPYGPRTKETGNFTWNFDTTGGTVNIKASKETIGKYPVGTAPDHKQLIGVNGEDVEGAEIIIPTLKLNCSFTHALGYLTLHQAKFLARLTGKTNSDYFLTCDPGEVLFLGATGSDGTESEATVSYQFAVEENLSSLVVGAIADIQKSGWHVLWIRYKDNDDSGKPVKEPQYVYVERVYESTSLSMALGFGG